MASYLSSRRTKIVRTPGPASSSIRVVRAIPIIQDLQEPRFRVGDLKGDYVDLKRGVEATVTGRKGMRGDIAVRPGFSFAGVKPDHRAGAPPLPRGKTGSLKIEVA